MTHEPPAHSRVAPGRLGRRASALAAALLIALPSGAFAREGVDVGPPSMMSKLVSADQVEAAARQQYAAMLQEASSKHAVAPPNHPQVVRLRTIAQRLIPFAEDWNPRAREWRWEVNVIGSRQINAFCMPGGKIAFFLGILEQLKLTDDEVAIIMGHEMAHALREHAREQMGKTAATRGAIELGAAIFGLGNGGRMVAGLGGQLLTLRFGRADETEADLVGIELAARAGYDPRAGVSLWNKMAAANRRGGNLEFLSTHPSGPTRISGIQAALPQVMPLYERAPKPPRRFDAALQGDEAPPRRSSGR
ncbi:M48 family metallopeptidase [Piscinibacter koreensis]|uniref:M48 family metallopeptidase n=1 Tax=Piscinibacter koreensis TaxID=2742824 RepID=A0A7Y6NJP5_9BURK|nr:M48 family metallopeptidase [Schlegelella koreensis]NUZ04433.1 M48 family metallopeptidase [Schlegelella koreensis]